MTQSDEAMRQQEAGDQRELIQQAWGALNFILAFYEPQNYLDTNAWKQAEAGGRRAHAALRAYLDAHPASQETREGMNK